ncbi:GDSL esterase/lipase At5g33370-like isoform X3 [Abrus precatorius]|uniref:GDSL esterase/lipase At5g33370-like isoform X3 n=1 Tax=Abrus precatorius TaxID=3816 RepID=A0A8B8LA32_ABRPR|nr:GDSL esterase/lipase At5g33370-like isoform X3 [Abrus precatorius]
MANVLVFGCCLVILSLVVAQGSVSAQSTRAFFVFGDSLVDSGNNDFLATTARADAPPYGIDFPTHRPTGRFSNGLNIPDIISMRLGLEPTLPYLSPLLIGEKLLIGANFASAGIGILNDTGIQFLHIIHIEKQLKLFQEYQKRLRAHIGAEGARNIVNRALVLITLGGNDFVNNYYLVPYSARSRQFSLPDYVRYLISEYRKVLTKLYDLGARRVLVTGTGPMGCVPAELAMRSRNGDCDVELQRAASLYNPQLVEMINGLNREIGADVFIAANAYRMHMDFVSNPRAYGTLLWARAIQWDWAVHTHFKFVPKQRPLRVLGSIPSIRESK